MKHTNTLAENIYMFDVLTGATCADRSLTLR